MRALYSRVLWISPACAAQSPQTVALILTSVREGRLTGTCKWQIMEDQANFLQKAKMADSKQKARYIGLVAQGDGAGLQLRGLHVQTLTQFAESHKRVLAEGGLSGVCGR